MFFLFSKTASANKSTNVKEKRIHMVVTNPHPTPPHPTPPHPRKKDKNAIGKIEAENQCFFEDANKPKFLKESSANAGIYSIFWSKTRVF